MWRAPANQSAVYDDSRTYDRHAAQDNDSISRRDDELDVDTPARVAPSARRSFRSPQGVDNRPLSNVKAPPRAAAQTPFVWGNNMNGAPNGAPTPTNDDLGHFGPDPRRGAITELEGVGRINWGNPDDAAPLTTDFPAHVVAPENDYRDQRANFRTSGSLPINFDPIPQNNVNVPNAAEPVAWSPLTDQKPNHWFTGGRVAKHSVAFFTRPFDKMVADNFNGNKFSPQAAPDTSGTGIDPTVPHAAIPNMMGGTVENGEAYAGGVVGQVGMTPFQQLRNTWRLQPSPWDANLLDKGI